ncbi:MAG: iron-siderophore ABC transporter substrate-binding protein [Cyanothece sp. SIO1E1]|nr:iron-siderophore ABC transporter substrate-binding protein [Cyanothece sp. SIO1E1]
MILRQSRYANLLLRPIFWGILTSLFTVACGGQTTDTLTTDQIQTNGLVMTVESCQTISHDLGDTQVCGQPQKLIALAPNILELLLALEIQPIGYADYFALPDRVFDQPAKQILYLGDRITSQPSNVGTWGNPSLEAIVKLKPDLILTSDPNSQNEYALLSQIAPTLVFNYTVDDDWQRQLRTIANATGLTEQAEQVIAAHKQKLTEMGKTLQPIAQSYPKVLLLASSGIGQNLGVEGGDSHCGGILQDLGFQMVLPPSLAQQQRGGVISLEILPQLDADLILMTAWNDNVPNPGENPAEHQITPVKQQWQNNPIAQSLEASKAGRVYFDSTYLCRALPGPIGTEIFLDNLRQQLQGEA